MNLGMINLSIDKNEVYEYYFMKHIFDTRNWLFEDYDRMVEELGGYAEQFTSAVYGIWMREWTEKRHGELLAKVGAFIDSGNSRL